MDILFFFLFFASIIALVVGLVNPSVFAHFLRGRATRKGTVKIFGISAIVSFVLFVVAIESSPPTQPATSTNNSAVRQEQQTKPAKSLSEEDQIRNLVADQLKGTNNMDKAYIRKIDILEQINGGWGVFVEYNADDNLTKNLRKTGIEKKMSEIYTALYTSDQDIRSAFVAAYFPLVDKYGNESDGVVYKSILDKEEADKVNWSSNPSLLQLSILPGVWTTSILHSEFR